MTMREGLMINFLSDESMFLLNERQRSSLKSRRASIFFDNNINSVSALKSSGSTQNFDSNRVSVHAQRREGLYRVGIVAASIIQLGAAQLRYAEDDVPSLWARARSQDRVVPQDRLRISEL
ncbi:hypothetical protein M6B38_387305 [Iris pallida]|uniref:Uncharacterized protein n=1 Tax=Iris pallida TaxID=29817 RepID=A0AAX6G205_IRIPA|nr:hypothetical protein M6B38_387305 [Iris pallida]